MNCPKFDDQKWLADALREVAADAERYGAPPRVEAAVVQAFRARHRRRWPVWSAAAALVVAGFVTGSWLQRPVPPPPRPAPIAAVAPPPLPRPAAPVLRAAKPRRRLPIPPVEVATEFIPLPYGSRLAPLERPRMLRMRLPRTVLLDAGLPMNMERAFEPVKADVVFDEDGMARAIRFIK